MDILRDSLSFFKSGAKGLGSCDSPDGPGNTVELEAWDISKYPDKSIEGIADLENENILLSPVATIEQSERTNLGPNPAYKIIYNELISPEET